MQTGSRANGSKMVASPAPLSLNTLDDALLGLVFICLGIENR